MSTKRFKQILPAAKFALSPEEDTYSSVALDGDMREIPEVETGENILVEEVFEDEREASTIYRISAQLNILVLLADPYIDYQGAEQAGSNKGELRNTTHLCIGTDDPTDPINGSSDYTIGDMYPQLNNINEENNWFIKVLYPESYLPNDTQISFSQNIQSGATIYVQDGLPILGVNFVEINTTIYPCFITETDVQLENNDMVYIDGKYIYHPDSGVKGILQAFVNNYLGGFRRVIYTDLNATELDIKVNGMRPADIKLFIIDTPIINANQPTQPSILSQFPPQLKALLLSLPSMDFNGSYKRVIGVSKTDIDAVDGDYMTSSSTLSSVDKDGSPNSMGQYTKVTTSSPHGLGKGFYIESRKLKIWTGLSWYPAISSDFINHDFTGIFRIDSIPFDTTTNKYSETEFILDANSSVPGMTATYIQFKGVDAIASEYKIRMFKELTGIKDYILDRTAFADSIYSNPSFLINVIKDVDVRDLTDYLDRPLSELFVGVIKRAGSKPYDWSRVVSHYSHIVRGIEGYLISPGFTVGDPGFSPIPGVMPLIYSETTNVDLQAFETTIPPLEYTYSLTNNYPSDRVKASDIQVDANGEVTSATYHYGTDTTTDGRYLGDLVEYNRGELTERVISDIYHRFNTTWRSFGYYNKHKSPSTICWAYGSSYEGLFYKPFHKYPIRKWASAVEAATPPASQLNDPFSAYTQGIQFEGVPTYAEEVQGLRIWRDLLDPGISDDEGVIDNPFLNGAHYLYDNIRITLRRQTPGRSSFSRWNKEADWDSSNTTYTPNDPC